MEQTSDESSVQSGRTEYDKEEKNEKSQHNYCQKVTLSYGMLFFFRTDGAMTVALCRRKAGHLFEISGKKPI